MESVAQWSAIAGLLVLLVILATAFAALIVLPFRTVIAPKRTSPNLTEVYFISLVAWVIYAVLTISAVFGEGFTLFKNAGFGFLYITLGMPVYLFAWLLLLVYATIKPVPPRLLWLALLGAGLGIIGYSNIN